jgi:dihydroxyacetone kinase
MSSKKPKSILNDPSHAVEEFVQGLCWQYPHRLIKLQHHNVLLLRTLPPKDSTIRQVVQLLSGGGSGHEPSHAGWIGTGMLRGAICGGMFASPSVSSILAAIRAAAYIPTAKTTTSSSSSTPTTTTTTRTNPVLLIVKNYTGDRLNFGLACERANHEGFTCDMVVVADDVALPRTKGITGARGVAGTVLLHKIAGAAAAASSGTTLADVKQLLQETAACLGTLGMALDSVTVPGAATVNDRLHDDSIMEIGLGIHGEAGLRQSKILTAKEMANEMIHTIQSYGRSSVMVQQQEGQEEEEEEHVVPMFQAGDELAMLINNLGGTSNFEMSILAKSCVETAEAMGAKVSRVYVGSYMTSFNMHGASLTILNLTAAPSCVAKYLDAPTDAPAWTSCEVWNPTNETDIRPSLQEWDVTGLSGEAAADAVAASKLPPLSLENFGSVSKQLVESAARALIEQEALLTKYDTIVGDGDCGITMKRGATQVLSVVEDSKVADHPVTLFSALADAVSASMGGTSGVLLELMFRKMSSTLARCGDSHKSIGAVEIAQAFEAGVNAVSLYGGAKVGARTMLDALVPAASALTQATNTSDSAGHNLLQLAAEKARQGADETATMAHASAGRSNYLSEETLTGTPDPGAVAVAVVFEAMANT